MGYRHGGPGIRVAELDGLRGVAILLVVAAHAFGGGGGVAGVQLFFVLSGYLITGVLLRGDGLVRFYRRRWRRLYPTLLVVSVFVVIWFHDWTGAVRAVTYTENIPGVEGWMWHTFGQPSGALGHTWSLAVEEQFYLCWPVLLLISGRHAVKVAAVGVGLCWVAQHTVPWSEHSVYVGLRWDAVLAGCLLALIPWKATAGWFLAGAVVLGSYSLGLVHLERWDYMLLTVGAVMLVAGAQQVNALRARWLVHVGHISYALYLWHVVFYKLTVPTYVWVALGFFAAEATYLLVDRQAQRLDPDAQRRTNHVHTGPVVRPDTNR